MQFRHFASLTERFGLVATFIFIFIFVTIFWGPFSSLVGAIFTLLTGITFL